MEDISLEELEKTVQEGLKNGKTIIELSSQTGKCRDYISKIKKQLVEKGVISEEIIKSAKFLRNKNDFLSDTTNQAVLKYVKAGLSQSDIARLVGRTQGVVSQKITFLIQYGEITQQEIDMARKQYSTEEKSDNLRKNYILDQLRKGKSKAEIARELGLTYNGVKYIVDALIAEGDITEEEIKEAAKKYRKENPRKSGEKTNWDDPEIDVKILEGVKKGYSQQEIVDKIFGAGNISQTYVGKRIKRLIEKGIITQKQVNDYKEQARKGRDEEKKLEERQRKLEKEDEQRQREKAKRKFERRIISLLKDGWTREEIAEELQCSKSKVAKKITELRDKGIISQEQLDVARLARREKDKRKRKEQKKAEKKASQAQKEEETKKQAEDEKKIRLYRERLRTAKKIHESDVEVPDEKINKVVRELIRFANTPLGKKILTKEEITIIQDTLFETMQMDINNIIGVAKLWIIIRDYQESIWLLNYSKNFFEREEDLEKIEKAVENVTVYRKKIMAKKLFRLGYNLEYVANATKLSVAELIRLQNGLSVSEPNCDDINSYPDGEEQE